MPSRPNKDREQLVKGYKDYAKYGGMAFQFLGATLLGVFIGKWLDSYFGFEKAVFAVFLTILFMLGAMYSVFKDILSGE